jgi:hypothetical protein
MAHFNAPAVTAKSAPAIHAGVNAYTSVYSLEGKTITGSQSIAMLALPPGARVRGARLSTSQIFGGASADVAVVLTTADTARATVIRTASAGTEVSLEYDPNHIGNTYKTTASSQVRVLLKGTFSASVSTTLALTLLYTTDEDGSGSSQP